MMSLFGHPITVWDLVSSLAYLAICIVGLVGNLLAIYVILKYTRMKTVTNQYILNLSISDTIFLLDLPLIIVGGILKKWIFGLVMCKVYFATTGINMFTGSFTLAVLSGDRYMAVCHPSKAVVYRTARNARIIILLTWLASLIFLIPIIIYADIFPHYVPQNITDHPPNSSSLPFISTPIPEFAFVNNDDDDNDYHSKRFQRHVGDDNDYHIDFDSSDEQSHEEIPFNHQRSNRHTGYRDDTFIFTEDELLDDITARLKDALQGQGLRLKEMNSSERLRTPSKNTNFNLLKDQSTFNSKRKRQETASMDEISVAATDKRYIATTPATPTSSIHISYTCTVDWPRDYIMPAVHAYIVYNMVIGFVIPVFIISILYTTLVVKLSKDPSQSTVTEDETDKKNSSFGKTIRRTFLSKESSFGKTSGSFRMRKSPSPKTPPIPENQILSYKTPQEIMKKIGNRSDSNIEHPKSLVTSMSEDSARKSGIGKINTIVRQSTFPCENVITTKPPPIMRNVSAFKQRRLQQPRITRLVTTIILVYVVCWLPYWAFQLHLLTNFTAVRDSKWKLTLYHIFTFLSYCNSAINPILYVFTNQNFKESFVGAVQCKKDIETKKGANQFKDSVRMKNRSNLPKVVPPAVAGGKMTWTPKLNGEKRIGLTRFYSCAPDLTTHDGGIKMNLETTKPQNNKNNDMNYHQNNVVDNKTVLESTDNPNLGTSYPGKPPLGNNTKPLNNNNENKIRPNNNTSINQSDDAIDQIKEHNHHQVISD